MEPDAESEQADRSNTPKHKVFRYSSSTPAVKSMKTTQNFYFQIAQI
jgi:hypothetical protein